MSTSAKTCNTWISIGTAQSIALSNLKANTTYYWQVRASNTTAVTYADGSPSSRWSFKTGGLPAAFGKIGPVNGQTGMATTVTLSWGASSGATSYQYCLGTKANNCNSWISTGIAQSITRNGLNPNTTYYWQVRANNTFGSTYANGSSTNRWSFTTAR